MIFITCPCGKKLQVKEEHAGKQVACPACKKRLVVPSRSAGPVKAIPLNPNAGIKPAPPSPVGIRPGASPAAASATPKPALANDGGPLASVHRVINNATGGKVSPNLVLLIGGGVVGVFVLFMCAGVSLLAVSWVFPSDSETQTARNDNSPVPDKKGNGGGGNTVVKPKPKPKPKTHAELRAMDLIPENTTAFLSFRVGDILASPLVATFDKKNTLAIAKTEFKKKFGMELTSFDRVVVVAPDPLAFQQLFPPKNDPAVEFLTIVETNQPYDSDFFLQATDPDTKPKSHNGKEYFLTSPDDRPPIYMHFFNRHIMVVGTQPNMQRFLEAKQARITSAHPLYEQLLASQTQHLTIMTQISEPMRDLARQETTRMFPKDNKFKAFLDMRAAQLTTQLHADRVEVNGVFEFSGIDQAQKANDSAEQLLKAAKGALSFPIPQVNPELLSSLSNIVEGIRLSPNGSKVVVNLSVSRAEIDRLGKAANQPGKGGGGPGPGPNPGPLVRYKGNGVSFLHPQNWPLEVKTYKFLDDVRISFTSRKGAVGQVWLYGGAASTPQEILKRETRSLRDIYGDKIKAAKSVRRTLFGQSCTGLAVDVELSAFTGLHVEVYAFRLPALRKVVNVRIEYDPEMEPGARKQLTAFLDSLRVSR